MASNQLLCLASRVLRVKNSALRQQWTQSSRALSAVSHSKVKSLESNQTELKNGIRVATEDMSSPTATVAISLDVGSRYESEQNTGVSNLLIHSLLNGSKSRNKSQLESELQKMGALLNATVDRDRTLLSVRCLSRDVSKAIEILGDLVSNPNFDSIESQKQLILREMQELDKNNETVVMNALHAMAYQNTPLALPPIGKSEVVSALTAKEVSAHYNTHVKGPRLVLSVAGGVDHSQIVRSAEQHLATIGSNYENAEIPVLERCRYTGSDIRIRDDALPLAHIALAVESPGFESADYLALSLASSLVGSWDRSYGGGTDCSSYLGLCSATDNTTHGFRSFLVNYKETGLFGVYMIVERMKQEDAVWHLTYEWKRFCTELTDNELNRAKNALTTQLMRESESTALVAKTIGDQVLNYGRRIPLDEMQSRILAINAKKVRAVCNDYIWDRCPVVSAIGPIEQLEDYELLRGKFYWFRY